MKNVIIVFMLMCFSTNFIKAQDTIITPKSVIACKLTKITSLNVFYTQNGVGKSIERKEVTQFGGPNWYKMVFNTTNIDSYTESITIKKTEPEKQIKEIKISEELTFIRNNLW